MERGFLAQCEQERLHLSGAIQDYGTLLAVAASGRVSHAAANIAQFLGAQPEDWIGRPLPAELAAPLHDLPTEPGSRRFLAGSVDGVDGPLDLSIHRSTGGVCVLEFTPADSRPRTTVRPLAWTPPFADDDALIAARRTLLEDILASTSAQRVMYYGFFDQGDGEVLEEVRQGDNLGSYLGLRFPASDIPQIARTLYLKNPCRLIADAQREPVVLLGEQAHALDLTWSDLRSVSPIHRVYLANMGVVGALSFPVVVAGQLSALISAHHHQVLQPARSVLETLAEGVKAFSLALAAYQGQCRTRLIDGLIRRFDSTRAILQRHGDLHAAWPEIAPILMQEFQADGAMLGIGNNWTCSGRCLEPEACKSIDAFILAQQDKLVASFDSLSRQVPDFPCSEIAGVLALRLQITGRDQARVYLTRCEHIHEVAWGGNPDKPVEFHDGELGIAPRRSFEKWVEKRLGYSRPWENKTKLLGLKLRELLLSELRT